MTPRYASREYLKGLSGLQRPSAICRWLKRQKMPFIMGADDWPRVLEVVIMEKMGGPLQVPEVEPEMILD